MDANGTFYHLLLGKDDWARCLDLDGRLLGYSWQKPRPEDAAHFAWDSGRNELTLEPHIFLYTAAPGDQPSDLKQRRGAACDRYGNWYWIDESRRKIRVRSTGSQQVADFWPLDNPVCAPPDGNPFQPQQLPPPPAPLTLGGLAVTEDHYLAVGVTAPDPGLLVFDLLTGEPPTRFLWPPEIPFAPFDIAPRPGGGVWILDRANKRYWELDRSFDVVAGELPDVAAVEEVFQPAGGPKRLKPQSILFNGDEIGASVALDACVDPIAIGALPDCGVLILDNNQKKYSAVSQYRFGKRIGGPVSTETMKEHLESGKLNESTLAAHDFAFVAASDASDKTVLGQLYIASQNGNQAFAFTLKTPFDLEPIFEEGCMLMRLFGGKGLVTCGDQVYYDIGERWVPLVKQPRLRYETEETLACEFDGKQPGCVWHRLMLDACIPPDTQVQIWSRAADEPRDLAALPWQAERIYRRGDGSELPFAPDPFRPQALADETGLLQSGDSRSSADGAGTWELLFQRATGRCLQIRMRLSGNTQRTPRLRAMRVYYPRFSYLEHYLPAVYRADAESASFLDRYLANTEGFYTAIEDKIAAVRQLFDVDAAPPETLDWLANWFGVALDPGWDDVRRRLFIRHAALLFQYRGTLPGLQMALRLALDACPDERIFPPYPTYQEQHGVVRIVEAFLTRRFAGVLYGDPTDLSSAANGSAQPAYWRPAQGRVELNHRYQIDCHTSDDYPIRDPGGDLSQAWRDFSQSRLGFIPAATDATLLLWQAYLLRTYGTIDKFNLAYGLTGEAQLNSFDQSMPPDELPKDGAPLDDWYRFETTFLPVVRNAHQFSVLLPMPADSGPNTLEYQRRLSLAMQVIELEKPAHTTYTIKFFWALFRVGEARLGLDTALDSGSRSSQLTPALVLDHAYLGQSNMGDDAPQGFTDRIVLQRGCAPNASPAAPANARKITIKRSPYASGCGKI